MARFDVYNIKGAPGYLLDCQADILSDLNTRIAVPLLSPELGPPVVRRLNPSFSVEDEAVVMYTQYAAAVPSRVLGIPITSLAGQHAEIMNALDMLLTGY